MQQIQKILNAKSGQIPACYFRKVIDIDQLICTGASYTTFGGKRIRQQPDLIRFKVGRGWRLIYEEKDNKLSPVCLIPRQQFEKVIRRRRK